MTGVQTCALPISFFSFFFPFLIVLVLFIFRFYGGRVQSKVHASERPLPPGFNWPNKEVPVAFIDVSPRSISTSSTTSSSTTTSSSSVSSPSESNRVIQSQSQSESESRLPSDVVSGDEENNEGKKAISSRLSISQFESYMVSPSTSSTSSSDDNLD